MLRCLRLNGGIIPMPSMLFIALLVMREFWHSGRGLALPLWEQWLWTWECWRPMIRVLSFSRTHLVLVKALLFWVRRLFFASCYIFNICFEQKLTEFECLQMRLHWQNLFILLVAWLWIQFKVLSSHLSFSAPSCYTVFFFFICTLFKRVMNWISALCWLYENLWLTLIGLLIWPFGSL